MQYPYWHTSADQMHHPVGPIIGGKVTLHGLCTCLEGWDRQHLHGNLVCAVQGLIRRLCQA